MLCSFYAESKEGVALALDIEVPFVPAKGMDISIPAIGEYRTVEWVMWDHNRPNQVRIHLEQKQSMFSTYEMLAAGWKVVDQR